MPLAGVILPTHEELSESEPGRYPKWLPPEDLLELATTWGPKDSPWNYELLHAAIGELYESTSISPTFLLGGCARSKIIERKEPYIALADDFYAMVRGSMIHQTLEHSARPGSIAEVKFITHVGDIEVRAIPDLVEPTGIWDWKISDNPPAFYPYKGHKRQVEMNRYVLNHAENWEKGWGDEKHVPDLAFDPRTAEFQHLTLMYLGPKWPKPMTIEKKQEFINPKGKTVEKKLPYVATDEEVEEWMLPLIDIYKLALDAYPHWPKGLENMGVKDTSGSKKIFPFGGGPGWGCSGKPICNLPNCAAKRYPNGLMWNSEK